MSGDSGSGVLVVWVTLLLILRECAEVNQSKGEFSFAFFFFLSDLVFIKQFKKYQGY